MMEPRPETLRLLVLSSIADEGEPMSLPQIRQKLEEDLGGIVSSTNLRHHLDVLVEEGLLEKEKEGRRNFYFLPPRPVAQCLCTGKWLYILSYPPMKILCPLGISGKCDIEKFDPAECEMPKLFPISEIGEILEENP